MKEIITRAIQDGSLRKIVLSRPVDKQIRKCTASPVQKDGALLVQLETLCADGKALHRNLSAQEAPDALCALFTEGYRQADILTSGGSCTVMRAKSGACHIKNGIRADAAPLPADLPPLEGKKAHILDDPSARPFLHALGLADEKGRILDRKRPKYRQINRFLELLRDVEDRLPDGELLVCDLCCGKSYLTFAVYWYLTRVLGRTVTLYGVDLKPDMMALCGSIAEKLGWDGMHFLCENALDFTPPGRVSLMISLHACDIATDIVMAAAVRSNAKILLSTPCCHHGMSRQLRCEALSFITDQPILRQKLCDAATDALRALRLELEDYDVATMELVDPEETPKNVLLRCVKRDVPLSVAQKKRLRERYDAACALLSANPCLDRLLTSGAVGAADVPLPLR